MVPDSMPSAEGPLKASHSDVFWMSSVEEGKGEKNKKKLKLIIKFSTSVF